MAPDLTRQPSNSGPERITPLADMNEATYDFYVVPLQHRIEQLQGELRQAQKLAAYLVEAAGGEVIVTYKQLLQPEESLTLYREDRPVDDGYRWFTKRTT